MCKHAAHLVPVEVPEEGVGMSRVFASAAEVLSPLSLHALRQNPPQPRPLPQLAHHNSCILLQTLHAAHEVVLDGTQVAQLRLPTERGHIPGMQFSVRPTKWYWMVVPRLHSCKAACTLQAVFRLSCGAYKWPLLPEVPVHCLRWGREEGGCLPGGPHAAPWSCRAGRHSAGGPQTQ